MHTIAALGSPTHWLILAIVFLLLFGSSRLPELARNLGKSLGVLKKARREFEEELMRTQETEQANKTQPDELDAQASSAQANEQKQEENRQA